MSGAPSEGRRLFFRLREADEYLAVLLADLVGEHVRHVVFLPQRLIQALGFRGADEDERELPTRERLFERASKRHTRRFAPRVV